MHPADFIQSQRLTYPDLAEQYAQLETLYSQKCVCARHAHTARTRRGRVLSPLLPPPHRRCAHPTAPCTPATLALPAPRAGYGTSSPSRSAS